MAVERGREPAGAQADSGTESEIALVSPHANPSDHIAALQQRLRRSEDRYRALVAATAQLIWAADAQGLTHPDVPTWGAFTGQSAEEATGQGWLDAVHPDDRAHTAELWAHAVATATPFEAEYRVRRHDGVYVHFSSRGVPVFEEDGSVREWIGFCSDISVRKKAEEDRLHFLAREQAASSAAVARAAELEAVFETMADAVVVYDTAGNLLHTNAAFRTLMGFAREPDFAARGLDERMAQTQMRDGQGRPLPRDQWPMVRLLRGEVLTGPHDIDITVRTLDGRDVQLNVSGAPVRGEEGRILGAVAIYRDVTERRQLERRTHESLHALLVMAEALVQPQDDSQVPQQDATQSVMGRLSALTRSVFGCRRVSITAYDAAGDAWQPLSAVGLSQEQEREWRSNGPGTSLRDYLDEAQRARLNRDDVLVVDASDVPGGTLPYGVQTLLVALMRAGRQLVGALALDYGPARHIYGADEIVLARAVAKLTALVIERERLLRERAEAQANALALRQANQRMDEFLGLASHELKTPLSTLSGNIQLMERRLSRHAGVGTDAAEMEALLTPLLARARRSLSRLGRLVEDLLDTSRIQADRLDLLLEPCDLSAIVAEVVQEQRQLAPQRAIELALPRQRAVAVRADGERIAQVVTNYLTNALKYAPEDRPITVGVAVEGANAVVRVHDEGQGIAPEEHAHIWERFYRAPGVEHRSGSHVGLGMGLHISRTIVERHGGRVGVESTRGRGATFWFTLPLAR